MKRLNTKSKTTETELAILNRTPFNVNSAKNPFASLYAINYGTYYVVYSYGPHFPIAVYYDGKWFFNESKESRTTSNHQRIVRQAFLRGNVKSFDYPIEEIRRLLKMAQVLQ